MGFRIADTFIDSLARLTDQEQKAVKTTAFDLHMNPANPGMQLHKLDRAKDPNFCSVRVSRGLRLILHKSKGSLLLCYVGHHDDAYRWAERRKLETHPKTGAAQLVEIRETVREIAIPTYVVDEQPAPIKHLLFADVPEDDLLSYGVPIEWLNDVRQADEDTVLELADHLPSEAAEALLELATGGIPQIAQPIALDANPFDHPDAQRRFRVMEDIEELERALDFPWEKWTVFLHPDQQQIVEGDYKSPARVSGSAGTGKTIVALHRAVYLARSTPDARVLLTTFSETLANSLKTKLRRLICNEPRLGERLEVHALNSIGARLYEMSLGKPQIASREDIRPLLSEAAENVEDHKFTSGFLMTEWEQVVDAWQLEDWESYRGVLRLGRKTRLPESRRVVLWSIFESVRTTIKNQGLITYSELFSRLASHYSEGGHSPYDYIVVDESQDISVAQLRFLAALGAERPNSLFFAGDLGQRIFQQPYSWKALGVDIRGRSRTLRINYRTSHQIRMQADRLLGPEISDVDCNTEVRARAQAAVEAAELPFKILDESVETTSGHVSISTMHLAKGLEFRAVVVMACDDEVIPLQERIETVVDDSDLEEVYNTERHLLYVACTRARDHLLVTGVEPGSEFLDDLSV
jgi:mRNA-degrading endonuclease RelE of RelBE toxin-antitoxin system